jgi:hypothetical protein
MIIHGVRGLVCLVSLAAALSAQVYSLQTVAGGALPENAEATSVSLGSAITAVAVDALGNVYLALESRHVVLRVSWTGVIARFAGNGYPGYAGDGGSALVARLNRPSGLAVDAQMNVYIAELGNRDVRKVANGIISTFAGGGGDTGEGVPARQALILSPKGIAADALGGLFIADASSHKVRRVSGGLINTVAGNGVAGYSGDGGAPLGASLQFPSGVAVDKDGAVYIADTGNNRIRKVAGSAITTVAGNGSPLQSGDGGAATAAGVGSPVAVAVDAAGSVYLTDWSRRTVRKITAGEINVVAGGGSGFTEGAAATTVALGDPTWLALDATNGLLVGDSLAQRVLLVKSGQISTVAGGGPAVGDNGPPLSALLAAPSGVAVDGAGAVYIADRDNFRVRKLANGVLSTVRVPVPKATAATTARPPRRVSPALRGGGRRIRQPLCGRLRRATRAEDLRRQHHGVRRDGGSGRVFGRQRPGSVRPVELSVWPGRRCGWQSLHRRLVEPPGAEGLRWDHHDRRRHRRPRVQR